jgi:hypothetical protein
VVMMAAERRKEIERLHLRCDFVCHLG